MPVRHVFLEGEGQEEEVAGGRGRVVVEDLHGSRHGGLLDLGDVAPAVDGAALPPGPHRLDPLEVSRPGEKSSLPQLRACR